MSRPRAFDVVAVLAAMFSAAVGFAAEDPLARPAFDQEIALEMKDADVVDIFRHIATTTGVPFVLEFESDPALTLSFEAKNMSVRALLSSIAHTYELKYEAAGDQIAVRPTGNKPAPRPAPRPMRLSGAPADRAPVYELRFEVRVIGGSTLSTPHVATQLNQVAEIKQGIERAGGKHLFMTFKVTPKRELGDGLELELDASVEHAVSDKRTLTENIVDTKVMGRDGGVLFTSEGYEVALAGWTLERTWFPDAVVDGSVYELRLELRRACGSRIPMESVTAKIGEHATMSRIVTPGAVNTCIGSAGPEFLTFKLSPAGENAAGLVLDVDARVQRRPNRGTSASRQRLTASRADTVLFKSDAGNELVLTGWGRFQPTEAPPQLK